MDSRTNKQVSKIMTAERRKKVSKACDYCKKRKYKCSGRSPCDLCSKKKIECMFSIVDRRTTKGIKKNINSSIEYEQSSSYSSGDSNMGKSPAVSLNRPRLEESSESSVTHMSVIQARGSNQRSTSRIKPIYTPKSLQPLLQFPLEDEVQDIHQDENDSNKEDMYETIHKEQANHNSNSIINSMRNTKSRNNNFYSVTQSNEESPASNINIQNSNSPKSNQPLEHIRPSHPENPAPATGLSNNYGKSSRLLFDSAGNLRYIGESSPLSLLFECRNIFSSIVGECEFTQDPQGTNIIDEPAKIHNRIPVQLPKRDHCNVLVKFFEINVNSTWYVFNMKYFKEFIVDYIYDNPIRARAQKLALLHLVLALGLLYAETSNSFLVEDLQASQINSLSFFESGCSLMKSVIDDGKLWLSEAYILVYFYYQSTSKRSTSWIMLGTAIRNAQALGLHRKFINESFRDRQYIMHRRKLWRSLYVCDRISSILLGRPLLIGDYDWDDFGNDDLVEYEDKINHDKNIYCLIEIAKVCKINGKIVHDFYLDGIIDPARAEKLAIELKMWSINLPKELQLDRILLNPESNEVFQDKENVLNEDRFSDRAISSDNFALLLVHLSQLYGIMLLGKPFFMYIAFKRNSRENGTGGSSRRRIKHETTMVNFCKASVKSSVLTIQLIHLYIEKHPQRIESYVTVNCCFMAALILGLSILHRKTDITFKDEYNIVLLMETLNTAKTILMFYGPINATSKRFHQIVSKMQRSLEAAFGRIENNISSSTVSPPIESNIRPQGANPLYNLPAIQQGRPLQPIESNQRTIIHSQENPATIIQPNITMGNESQIPGNNRVNGQTINYNVNGNNSPADMTLSTTNVNNNELANDFFNNTNRGMSLPQTPFSNTDLKSFMNFQQFFVPSLVGVTTSSNDDFSTQSSGSPTSEALDVFMYNVGTNDILFDGNI